MKKLMVTLLVMLISFSVFANGKTESASDSSKISGDVIIAQPFGGSEGDAIQAVADAFMLKYPEIKVKMVNTSSGAEDQRAGMKVALLSGEKFDLAVSTWPSFEAELRDAGLLEPIDRYWEQYNWDEKLGESWKNLGVADGKAYSVYFFAGDRSGLWYNKEVVKAAGITEEPKTWDEFTQALDKLKAAGKTPIALGAKTWAQGEWFTNILLKVGGTEAVSALFNREIPWTDPVVVEALDIWAELLNSGYFAAPAIMLGDEWSDAADKVFSQKTAGYTLCGSWVNGTAQDTYGLTPVTDYGHLPLPPLNDEFGKTMSIDGKNFVMFKAGQNHDAAALFLDFIISEEGANIIASYGLLTPSNEVDLSLFDGISAQSIKGFGECDVFFNLADMLPTELGYTFWNAMQKFISDPTPATIAAVTQEIENKAVECY